ncbi:hypothetical protein [Sporosarcina newyorkensis]|uniref:hypothetical protein n=1 Tax=Sporosarcina newyorkensis TaxID=759851 RepID=UPI0011169B45|nr:hypothetical protein [Sporosarcina newyorkensis]
MTINFLKASSSYVSATVFGKLVRQFNFNYYRYKFELSVNGSRLLDQIVEAGRTTGGTIKEVPFVLDRYLSTDIYTVNLYQEVKNTAPTTPGAFTQPTGTLEIGDTKAISWGLSTDADGNLHGYEFEVSVDGGSWVNRGLVTTPSISYTIPTAKTIKFRVRARDNAGLYSAHRESPVYTVSKPTYYWSKYNSELKRIYKDDAPWESAGTVVRSLYGLYPSYSFNPETNKYSLQGTMVTGSSRIPSGTTLYQLTSNVLNRYTTTGSEVGGNDQTTALRYNREPALNTSYTLYVRGSLLQTNIQSVEGTFPIDDRHSDGYWYIRGSRVNQSIAPPGPFTQPAANTVLEPKETINLYFSVSPAESISVYEVQYRYNGGSWSLIGIPEKSITKFFTVTDDKTLTSVEFRVRAKNTSGVYSDYVYSEAFQIQHNKVPTITLETENNKTLYEKDTFTIKGSAVEPDIGDVLIVYYRLNGGTARGIETKLSDGSAIPFNEQLLFKSGKLYKGDTEITGMLTEGTAHTLEVWAEDNQGGKSEVERRIFYVVPNRPPSLTIDPIEYQSDLINVDKVTITGESYDPDGNDVLVRYRINNGINVEIHNGSAGPFTFDISLSKLKDDENSIVVEVADTYDFKASETIVLIKDKKLTPLTASTMRYTIKPPAGSAKSIALWILRDPNNSVKAEISMTNGTEPEDFKPMELDSSGPADNYINDLFKYEADSPAEHIAIKLSWTGDKPIIQVSGALFS